MTTSAAGHFADGPMLAPYLAQDWKGAFAVREGEQKKNRKQEKIGPSICSKKIRV